MNTEITITIDKGALRKYTDTFLALAWHLSQANPAPHADRAAGELAESIAREIIRRWLRGIEPELWHHQGRDYYWNKLTAFAQYVPPPGATGSSSDFHKGEWIAREKSRDETDDSAS